MYRIVTNLALNRVKQQKRERSRAADLSEADALAAADQAGLSAEPHVRALLEKALHELPTLQRSVVILRHMEGMSTKQVSEILRCSEGTVKTHLFRAMEKLRRRLAHLQEEATL
jgi:RNA polymerase sigma-70 factor (ECF subfamily)